ncbi:Serine/Threonine-Protein Kinase Dclk2 [Manis pentadactyla]|nr:Serine/Threonine-Protein Kinase Dclk2 [Manis pentadactyla]
MVVQHQAHLAQVALRFPEFIYYKNAVGEKRQSVEPHLITVSRAQLKGPGAPRFSVTEKAHSEKARTIRFLFPGICFD